MNFLYSCLHLQTISEPHIPFESLYLSLLLLIIFFISSRVFYTHFFVINYVVEGFYVNL